jgi:AcrR family transcriptional regulator
MRRRLNATLRSQQTRDRLRDAGRVLFAAHGYEAVGTREIVAYAGVNLSTIKYHFGSKQELLNDILVRDLSFVAGRMALAVEAHDSPPARMRRYVAALGEVARRRPWFPPILVRELMIGGTNLDGDVRRRVRAILDEVRFSIDAGRHTGAFAEVESGAMVLTCVGALASLAFATRPSGQDRGLRRPVVRRAKNDPEAMPGRVPVIGSIPKARAYAGHLQDLIGRSLARTDDEC